MIHPIVLLSNVGELDDGQILLTHVSVDLPGYRRLNDILHAILDTFLKKNFLFKGERREFFILQKEELIAALKIYL